MWKNNNSEIYKQMTFPLFDLFFFNILIWYLLIMQENGAFSQGLTDFFNGLSKLDF